MKIRKVTENDAEALLAIYAPYVEHTAITFEYEVPTVGEFQKCGYKFQRWYNMVWMEKIIGEHTDRQLSPIPFSQLEDIHF